MNYYDLGILASGVTVSHLNTILASFNMPTTYHALLKRYEREVGFSLHKESECLSTFYYVRV